MLLHVDKHQNQQTFGPDHISCVDKLTTPNLKYQICSNKLKDVRYLLKSYHLIEFAGEHNHQSAVAHDDFCSFKAFCSTLCSVFFFLVFPFPSLTQEMTSSCNKPPKQQKSRLNLTVWSNYMDLYQCKCSQLRMHRHVDTSDHL